MRPFSQSVPGSCDACSLKNLPESYRSQGMKCPHCLESFHDSFELKPIAQDDKNGEWFAMNDTCAACGRIIILLRHRHFEVGPMSGQGALLSDDMLVYPKAPSRAPAPKAVPRQYSEDYSEACLVLGDSPKASAALSRRCLQHVLREAAKVKKTDLSKEIQEVLDRNMLPSHLAQGVDAVRHIGNFAAHTTKSTTTGEIISVEPGEAEWNLDVLEGLFDFFFVQPEILKAKREALNKKLKDAGKPPLK